MTVSQLKAKYLGTGHADQTKFEFLSNQHRDTSASILGHYDQLSYYAVSQNESIGRLKLTLLDSMIEPCGKPPPPKDIESLYQQKQQEKQS